MLLSHYPTLTHVVDLMIGDDIDPAIKHKLLQRINSESLEPVGIFDRAEAELSKLSELDLLAIVIGSDDDEDEDEDDDGCATISSVARVAIDNLFEMIS